MAKSSRGQERPREHCASGRTAGKTKRDAGQRRRGKKGATDSGEEKIDQGFELNLVKTAIKELPNEQQIIIIMKFVEDLTNKEIAAALGKSEGAVKTAQHRSIQNLKKIINGKHNQTIKGN